MFLEYFLGPPCDAIFMSNRVAIEYELPTAEAGRACVWIYGVYEVQEQYGKRGIGDELYSIGLQTAVYGGKKVACGDGLV